MHGTVGLVESFEQLMRTRRSVRGYKPDPIPHDVLEEVFATAQLSPSNCNVQPWVVHVVSGAAADKMRADLTAHVMSGAQATPDFPLTDKYPGEYRTRQIGAAVALFSATGVARDDHMARMKSMLRNFEFFDAPHALFLFMPEWAGWREAADCGMYAQSLMLAMAARGIGSCAQGALSHYAAFVKSELGVADEMKLLFGISFGYEDDAHPANRARTDRASVQDAIHFHNS